MVQNSVSENGNRKINSTISAGRIKEDEWTKKKRNGKICVEREEWRWQGAMSRSVMRDGVHIDRDLVGEEEKKKSEFNKNCLSDEEEEKKKDQRWQGTCRRSKRIRRKRKRKK